MGSGFGTSYGNAIECRVVLNSCTICGVDWDALAEEHRVQIDLLSRESDNGIRNASRAAYFNKHRIIGKGPPFFLRVKSQQPADTVCPIVA
jgi:hypothetical protein